MLSVSGDFLTATSAPVREWQAELKFYFDGESNPPVVFEDDRIVDFDLLEESAEESRNPFGFVSSNELAMTLVNDDRVFTPTNTASPYYGKLKPNVKVEAELKLKVDDDPVTWESVPLGTFRTGDWDAPSENVHASVVGHDRLYSLGEKELDLVRVQSDLTLYDMWVNLFTFLGLSASDYEVDATLTQVIEIGWYPKGRAKEAMQQMAQGGGCYVYVDRNNKIQVVNARASSASVVTLTDQDQIMDIRVPQKHQDMRSAVEVSFIRPTLGESKEILRVDDIELPSGTTTFEFEFSDGPVALLEQVSVLKGTNITIDSIHYGTWGCRITITAPDSEGDPILQIISIAARGQVVDKGAAAVRVVNAPVEAEIGEEIFTLETNYIQSAEDATDFANALLALVSDPAPFVNVLIRANPALELSDTVTIDDPSDKVPTVETVIRKSTLRYMGGLDGELSTIKRVLLS